MQSAISTAAAQTAPTELGTDRITEAFQHLRKTNPACAVLDEITLEWAQPAPTVAKDTKEQYTPLLFSSLVLRPEDVDIIRLHETGYFYSIGPSEEPDLTFGLDQVMAGNHFWGNINKPFWNQRPAEEAWQFPTRSKKDEDEISQFVLSRMTNRSVSLKEITFEKKEYSSVAHVDDATFRIWFDTDHLTSFITNDAASGCKLDAVCESFAASLAASPGVDFHCVSNHDLNYLNNSIKRFLASLQVLYPKKDYSLILDSAIEMGKRRKMAIIRSPRCPVEFYERAQKVIIPRTTAWVKNGDEEFFSAFAPLVIAHPSYGNRNAPRPQPTPRINMPSFLTKA